MDRQGQAQVEESSTNDVHPNRNIIFASVALFALFIFSVGIGWYWSQERGEQDYQYTIPGVPTINMYDSRALDNGITSPFMGNLIAILQYWGVSVDLASRDLETEILSLIRDGYLHIEELESFLNERGLKLDAVYANSFEDLQEYINPNNPVPLLYAQLFSTSDLNLYDYKLLVGLDQKNNEVVTNNFTRGHLYRVSVDTFDQLWDLHYNESSKRRYFIITPQDPQKIQERIEKNRIAEPYPPRTSIMDELEPIFVNFLLNQRTERDEVWIKRLNSMIESPLFEKLHPITQLSLYLGVARYNFENGNFDVAYEYIEKGIALNQNLNEPYPGWGRATHEQIPYPYSVLTQYYEAKGETERARETYEGQYTKLYREIFGQEPTPYPY